MLRRLLRTPRMRSTTAIVVTGLLALGLAACGEQTASGTKSGSPDTLVVALPAIPENLDPSKGAGTPPAILLPEFESPLVRQSGVPIEEGGSVAPGGKVQAYAASEWKTDDKGNYLFTLRDGAKSPEGNVLSSADVKYSFDRAMAIHPTSNFLLGIANIDLQHPLTVVDEKTVRVNVTAPGPLVLPVLTWYSTVPIFDSKVMTANKTDDDPWSTGYLSTHSASFGAYYVSDFKPGESITLKANPNFWGDVKFTTVIVKAVPDPSVRGQLVLSGEADFTNQLSWPVFQDVEGKAKDNGVTAEVKQIATSVSLYLNNGYGPLKDARVREAINLTVDREAIVDSIYHGYGKPATYVPGALDVPFDVPAITSDITRAKSLMAEAGYASGFEVSIAGSVNTDGPGVQDTIVLLQSQLAKIGITVKVTMVPSAAEFTKTRNEKKFAAYVTGYTPAVADFAFWQSHRYSQGSNIASDNYKSAEFEQLSAQLMRTPAGPQYDALAKQIYSVLARDIPLIPLVDVPQQVVTRSDVTGYLAYPHLFTYFEYLSHT